MGLSSEAGRRLAQQFEQHHIRKRYHAIVRGWLMDDAVLDYPLVEERDKIADKFAREDQAPAGCNAVSRTGDGRNGGADRTLSHHALWSG